nr:T9SS type A sorting domain-containing protein [uncultured Brumimicrobium sp.]
MHKLLFITLLLSFYSTFINAQGHYDKCYFGTAGVDFGDGYPSVLLNSQMIAVETAVSVCSENGTLLFYSNGGNSPLAPSSYGAIWNANHQVMENGLLGETSGCVSSFQGGVAFPANVGNSKSFSNSKYFIFMRDCVESSVTSESYNTGLTYCEIDMSANNGLGKVINVNTAVPFDPGYGLSTNLEPVAAILKGTDDGWYVFSYNLDSLYSIEVNSNGVGGYKSHVVGEMTIVFSPSRNHVVVGSKLYNYDALNNELVFNMSLSETTYAFSPNGKLLYGLGSGKLYQYDLTSSNISTSKLLISSTLFASSLYLAPDARIYVFNKEGLTLPGYIECPNTLGENCGLTMAAVDLGGKQSGDVFTNIPANFLYYDGPDCNLSVKDNTAKTRNLEIYPNPSEGKITIVMDELESPVPFNIFSLRGQVVFEGVLKSHEVTFDLCKIEKGIYFLEVNGVKKRLVLR